MKIFLVDENEKFRANLRLYLEGYLYHEVVGETSDEMHVNLYINQKADIFLINLNSSIIANYINSPFFCPVASSCKAIALSQHKEIIDSQILLKLGFKGFVSKENLYRDLENAINSVYAGELYYPIENLI
jgi:DNA-binding NarL/FixJ family response regulator